MRRKAWLALAVSLLACASAARAQSDRIFAPVPVRHWAYQAVRELAANGYAIGFADATFDGSRILTRYEFATAINHLRSDLPSKIGQPRREGDLPRSLDEQRADVAKLRRLLTEFQDEVRQLGVDTGRAQTALAAVEGRIRRLEIARKSSRPRQYGLEAALQPPVLHLELDSSLPNQFPSRTLSSRLRLPDGATTASLSLIQPRPLFAAPRRPLDDPAARINLQAQLSRPVGKYLVSAFYVREGAQPPLAIFDANSLGVGPRAGLGASISRSFGSNLRVNLSGTSYAGAYGREEGDLLAFRGGIHYLLSRQLSLDVGFERLVRTGLDPSEARIYNIGVGRSFGRNMRLQLLYQYFNLRDGGVAGGGGRSAQDGSAAITRFLLRF